MPTERQTIAAAHTAHAGVSATFSYENPDARALVGNERALNRPPRATRSKASSPRTPPSSAT
ncbi:hypothetical protein AB0I77_35535 [Streptomyces sp. NPDC050619]|uniref:hypothetical protein n=1 Tax=Streptomyces sp. NPDC050619 TaxID=3157214 RepID=UPI00342A164D